MILFSYVCFSLVYFFVQSAALCLKALRCDNGGLSLSYPSGDALGTVGCFTQRKSAGHGGLSVLGVFSCIFLYFLVFMEIICEKVV